MPTNMLETYSVIGQKEDVDDKIYRVSPEETPFVSMIGRKSVDSVTPEWQRDALRAAANNAKAEGLDSTYAAQVQPERLSNKCQIISDTLSVTGTSDRVAKYGRKSESARLKAKKMVELKKDIEWSAISKGAFVAGSAGVAREMRGLYGWVATNNELGVAGSPAAPVIATNTGKELELINFRHPFYDRLSTVCLAEYVKMVAGTGRFQWHQGAGQDDFPGLERNAEGAQGVGQPGHSLGRVALHGRAQA